MDFLQRNWQQLGATEAAAAVEVGGRELRDSAATALQGLGDRVVPLTGLAAEAGGAAFENVKKQFAGVSSVGAAVGGGMGGSGGMGTRSMLPMEIGGDRHGDAGGGGGAAAEDLEMQSLRDELGEYLNLTWSQRVMAFVMCFGSGAIMTFMSVMFLPMVVLHPAKFALSFTFGNILAIVSTWFIVGPRTQLRSMFDPSRSTAAIVYVSSLFATLLFAFFGGSLRYILVLISVVIEVLALVWYSLSYIPYSRTILTRAVGYFIPLE